MYEVYKVYKVYTQVQKVYGGVGSPPLLTSDGAGFKYAGQKDSLGRSVVGLRASPAFSFGGRSKTKRRIPALNAHRPQTAPASAESMSLEAMAARRDEVWRYACDFSRNTQAHAFTICFFAAF